MSYNNHAFMSPFNSITVHNKQVYIYVPTEGIYSAYFRETFQFDITAGQTHTTVPFGAHRSKIWLYLCLYHKFESHHLLLSQFTTI